MYDPHTRATPPGDLGENTDKTQRLNTHTWLLKSFMISRKWLYTSGWSWNCSFTASKYPRASETFKGRASVDGPPAGPPALLSTPFIAAVAGVAGLGVFLGVRLRDGEEGRLTRAAWASRKRGLDPKRGAGAGSLG